MTCHSAPDGSHGTVTVDVADSALMLMAVGTNYRLSPQIFLEDVKAKLDTNAKPDAVVAVVLDAAGKSPTRHCMLPIRKMSVLF